MDIDMSGPSLTEEIQRELLRIMSQSSDLTEYQQELLLIKLCKDFIALRDYILSKPELLKIKEIAICCKVFNELEQRGFIFSKEKKEHNERILDGFTRQGQQVKSVTKCAPNIYYVYDPYFEMSMDAVHISSNYKSKVPVVNLKQVKKVFKTIDKFIYYHKSKSYDHIFLFHKKDGTIGSMHIKDSDEKDGFDCLDFMARGNNKVTSGVLDAIGVIGSFFMSGLNDDFYDLACSYSILNNIKEDSFDNSIKINNSSIICASFPLNKYAKIQLLMENREFFSQFFDIS